MPTQRRNASWSSESTRGWLETAENLVEFLLNLEPILAGDDVLDASLNGCRQRCIGRGSMGSQVRVLEGVLQAFATADQGIADRRDIVDLLLEIAPEPHAAHGGRPVAHAVAEIGRRRGPAQMPEETRIEPVILDRHVGAQRQRPGVEAKLEDLATPAQGHRDRLESRATASSKIGV